MDSTQKLISMFQSENAPKAKPDGDASSLSSPELRVSEDESTSAMASSVDEKLNRPKTGIYCEMLEVLKNWSPGTDLVIDSKNDNDFLLKVLVVKDILDTYRRKATTTMPENLRQLNLAKTPIVTKDKALEVIYTFSWNNDKFQRYIREPKLPESIEKKEKIYHLKLKEQEEIQKLHPDFSRLMEKKMSKDAVEIRDHSNFKFKR
jgi:hypothetical protein